MTTLLVTLSHDERDLDLEIRVNGPATVGDVVDAVVEAASLAWVPPTPSFEVARSSETLARDTRLTDANLRSGDRIVIRDASSVVSTGSYSAAAIARIVDGPHRDREFTLGPGPSDIGRAEECDICIADKLASRHHARVVVSDHIYVADLGSTNGVLVNDQTITDSVTVTSSDRVTVGGTAFQFDLADTYSASSTGQVVEFNRPPRVFSPFAGIKVKLPAPPDEPPKQYLPMIAALVPLGMAGAMWTIFGAYSALFMLMSPVIILGSYYEGKRSGRRGYKERVAEHIEILGKLTIELDEAREEEITSRRHEHPNVTEVIQSAQRLSPRLWERHVDEKDFLALHIGRADQESRTVVELDPGGSRDNREELAEFPLRYARIPDLPTVVGLRQVGGLGIAGPTKLANQLARSLVAQLAGLHAPNDVVITALLGSDVAVEWRWLSWLPHLRSTMSPLKGRRIGFDYETCERVFSDLLDEVNRRLALVDGKPRGDLVPSPAVTVVIDEGAPLDRGRIAELLEKGPMIGVYFIWLCSSRRALPRQCGAVVDLQARTGDVTLGFRMTGDEIGGVEIEGLDLETASEFARVLTPVVETGARERGEASIPGAVSLVELLGGTEVMNDPGAVIDRWRQGEEGLGRGKTLQLRAPIGRQADAPLSIDMRSDGPHALVAGTTGAGKSELLQSYVVSLAATHSARRVSFLLIDYKGGAAFKDCVHLPHVVGLVTDLNTSEVRRALVSLEAELRHRELILNKRGAKDLVELEGLRYPQTPPSLILVIDEFAALAKEIPEFIEGIVDVALRGRSLGIHLLLATQRPAGVVTPQIRANTSLRIALRVADDDDSKDVIGTTGAAALDPGIPGRAIAKLGPRRPVLFQSAYVGGVTQATVTGPTIHVSELEFDCAIAIVSQNDNYSEKAPTKRTVSTEELTDLRRLVANIGRAHQSEKIDNPRRPWHPPLAAVYDLARLRRSKNDDRIVIGVVDIPSVQRQEIAYFKPDKLGSLLVVGASGSGKTVLLRTIAASTALPITTVTTHVYGLDFAGRGLEMLGDLPNVGAIVEGQDNQRVTRLLRDLRARVDDRSKRFSAVRAGSLSEYRSASGGQSDEPRIFVLLDGYPAFHSAYERVEGGRWIDGLTQLVGDGRQFGVHFVLTADRRTAFPLALSSAVPGRVFLRLATQDDYSAAGLPLDIITESSPPGRAIFDGVETQIAVLGGGVSGEEQTEAMADLGELVKQQRFLLPQAVRILPERVTFAEISPRSGETFTIGLRDSDLGPATVDLDTGGFLVSGPPRSGKTTALEALVEGAPSTIGGTVIVGSRASQLTQPRARCRVALGEQEGAVLLQKVIESSVRKILVVVDDLHEFSHTGLDDVLAEVLRVAREREFRVLVSTDVDAARRAYEGALKDVRANRSGLLLQPDNSVDGDIVGVRLPAVATTTWPPGRGYLAVRGSYELCQVASV